MVGGNFIEQNRNPMNVTVLRVLSIQHLAHWLFILNLEKWKVPLGGYTVFARSDVGSSWPERTAAFCGHAYWVGML